MHTMQKIFVLFFIFNSWAVASPNKQVAITIDDLPGWQPVNQGIAEKILTSLSSALKKEKVPATGYLIGELSQRTVDAKRAIEIWASTGLALGNHTWNHISYSKADSKDFWDGVKKTELVLEPLRNKYGPWPLSFRFPMLNQGNTQDKKLAADEYLEKTKTLLAFVSIDTSDWAFAQYYDEAIEKNDAKKMKAIQSLYLNHIFDCIDYAEKASKAVFLKQIPMIILLHANSLNAKKLNEIILHFKKLSYSFISITDALNSEMYLPYRYKIPYTPSGDNFFAQMGHILIKDLPQPDRSSYDYFHKYWEPKLKNL